MPNITILRCLIEAYGYYFAEKENKLQEIVKSSSSKNYLFKFIKTNIILVMNEEKIDSMNLHGSYISAVSAGRSLKKENEKLIRCQSEINEDGISEENKKKFLSDVNSLKKTNPQSNLSQFQNIVLDFDDECPQCNRMMFSEEIFSGWKKSHQEYITSCPACKKPFSST